MRLPNHRKAVGHLTRSDPVLAKVIEQVGPCRYETRPQATHFEALARAIIFQQLSGKAAGTIYRRVAELFPSGALEPRKLLELSDETLRAAGLSRQKIGYLRDLAAKALDGTLALDDIETTPDAEVIEHLIQVKGIGRWTAHMFLMFQLGRPDVLPGLDLGIQNAVKRAYRLRKHPTPDRIAKIGAKWSPYSTIACWYLWRSLENGDGQGGA